MRRIDVIFRCSMTFDWWECNILSAELWMTFWADQKEFHSFFSNQNRMKLIWYAHQRLKKDRHKSWKHLLIHNRKRSSYSKSIMCLSPIRRSSALLTEVEWSGVFIKSKKGYTKWKPSTAVARNKFMWTTKWDGRVFTHRLLCVGEFICFMFQFR